MKATWTKWDEMWAVRIEGELHASNEAWFTTIEVSKKDGSTSEVEIIARSEYEGEGFTIHHISKNALASRSLREQMKQDGAVLTSRGTIAYI
jgi:hypothetical protein